MPGRSGSVTEKAGDEGSLDGHVVGRYGTHLSLGQHCHGLDTGEGSPRRPKVLKAEHRPGPPLDPAVVLLNPVVEPPTASMLHKAPQRALALHLPESARIALEPVGH